ncbi:MAG: TRAP transporter small permease [Treponemataceae bacterium]
MKLVKLFLKGLMRAELALGAFLAIYIIAVMVVEIVMRYVFNNSIIWIQESVMLAFIWVVALGATCALITGSHVTIDTFSRSLPPKAQKTLKVFVSLLVMVCLVFLAATLPKSILIQNKSRTASLPINFPKGYYYSLPILVSVAGMILAKLYYLYYEVRDLFGLPNPETYKIVGSGASESEEKVDVL